MASSTIMSIVLFFMKMDFSLIMLIVSIGCAPICRYAAVSFAGLISDKPGIGEVIACRMMPDVFHPRYAAPVLPLKALTALSKLVLGSDLLGLAMSSM